MFTRVVGSAVIAAGLLLCAPALAAPTATGVKAAVPQTTDAVKRVAEVDSDDDGAACTRARRRLWVEGEGWVVRRITTCR